MAAATTTEALKQIYYLAGALKLTFRTSR